jgi:transposase-like protein
MSKAKTPRTLREAVLYFSDPDRCLAYVVSRRWPNGVTCPTCGSPQVYFLANQRRWKCSQKHAKRQFSAKVGSIFEDSPIPFEKWLPAMWLLANCKNGISSYELARDLGVTQRTAWFMLHRIRTAMQESGGKLGGGGKTVEVDESLIGGKARWMNKKRLRKAKAGTERGPAFGGKAIVLGMLERGGRIRTRVIPDVKGGTLRPLIRAHVVKGSGLHTDEGSGYQGIELPVELPENFTPGTYPVDYIHEAVNHQAGEYVRENVHTNGIENFWALLKRSIRGTYVSVEPFHLFRYLDEQGRRFNMRKETDGERFASVLDDVAGRRLTYKQLTTAPES